MHTKLILLLCSFEILYYFTEMGKDMGNVEAIKCLCSFNGFIVVERTN